MAKYKQYILRLNPNTDAALIAFLEEAGREWGGVQRRLKAALEAYRSPAPSPRPSQGAHVTGDHVPQALLDAIRRAAPDTPVQAARAMAQSPPLAHVRALYAAFAAMEAQRLTEMEAILLQELKSDIDALLQEASNRPPIRKTLKGDER